jgi:hypothetical protein
MGSKIGKFELNIISNNRNNRKAFDEFRENINIPDEPKIMKKVNGNDLRKIIKDRNDRKVFNDLTENINIPDTRQVFKQNI